MHLAPANFKLVCILLRFDEELNVSFGNYAYKTVESYTKQYTLHSTYTKQYSIAIFLNMVPHLYSVPLYKWV